MTKKNPAIQKSLALILSSLIGMEIVIELKNNTEVTGTLEETDFNMNSVLVNASKITATGIFLNMDIVYLSGSTIRCIHIPQEINILKHISTYVSVSFPLLYIILVLGPYTLLR